MANDNRNAEGYPDPTASTAIANAMKGEKSPFRPLVYISSPYRGDEAANTLRARYYCRFAVGRGVIPVAPHIYFTQFLDDAVPKEREVAMQMNFNLLTKCSEIWVFGNCLTEGMKQEVNRARWQNKKIRYFTEDLEETTDA